MDWITVNGKHIPVGDGQSKKAAYEKAFAQYKSNKSNVKVSKATTSKQTLKPKSQEKIKQENFNTSKTQMNSFKKEFNVKEVKKFDSKADSYYGYRGVLDKVDSKALNGFLKDNKFKVTTNNIGKDPRSNPLQMSANKGKLTFNLSWNDSKLRNEVEFCYTD